MRLVESSKSIFKICGQAILVSFSLFFFCLWYGRVFLKIFILKDELFLFNLVDFFVIDVF